MPTSNSDDNREPFRSPASLEPTRRHLFLSAIYGLWGLIAAAFSIPAALFLFLPPKLRQRANWIDLGDLSRFAHNSPEEVVFRHNRIDGWSVISEEATAWVVVRSQQNVSVFAPQCTHLGCAYHWDEGNHNFYCPCHSSTFSIEGQVLGGPAPRPLDQYTVRLNMNHIEVGPLKPHA
jgi:quinol---cytochrome c reductase iron-sulfur subunit, bacillus type